MKNSGNSFVIVSPPYANNSAGIAVLHLLYKAIFTLGYNAEIIFIDNSVLPWKFYTSYNPHLYHPEASNISIKKEINLEWISMILQNGVTIYPEIITGNPLNAKNVVRYFLNGDGVITGHKSLYESRDFLISFSKQYHDNPNAYLIKLVSDSHFNDTNTVVNEQRSLSLTYFGKGPKYFSCFKIKNTVVLSSEWPSNKEELAILLKCTKYLYCWDTQSSITSDAILCGAKVVYMQFNQLSESEMLEHEFGVFPYLKGIIDNDNNIVIEDYPDYDVIRSVYIEKIKNIDAMWNHNVSTVIHKIFNHFKED
jgi:hypothetical protein